ncbi:hypothetical protein D3C85_741330 [compost metagenome]
MNELTKGNDELADWAKENAGFFHITHDDATQEAFAQVAGLVADQTLRMKTGAMEEFLAGADPWLIAKGL